MAIPCPKLPSRNAGKFAQNIRISKMDLHPSHGDLEDSDSEISSTDDCDCFGDSYMSASSVSSGPDEESYGDLSPSLKLLRFGQNTRAYVEAKDPYGAIPKCSVLTSKDLVPGNISVVAASTCDTAEFEPLTKDCDRQHAIENSKVEAEPKSNAFTANALPASPPLTNEEYIQLKSLLKRYRTSGSRNNQGQGRGGGPGNQAKRNTRSVPHQVPPAHWGKSKQRQDRDEDSDYDEKFEGISDNSPNRQRHTRKILYACPGAKGDPFRNRECLRSTFPNLAKTRQHLACGTHFAVGSTTHLPDAVKDPNGWDSIMKYIYPEKEVPSSEPDFDRILDVIERQGEGEGKPDFLSYMTRMIRNCLNNRDFGQETLSLFEAIGGHSAPPKPQPPRTRHDMEISPTHRGEEPNDDDFDMLSDIHMIVPHPPHIQPEPHIITSYDSLSPVNINPTNNIISDPRSSFSAFSPTQPLYSPIVSHVHTQPWTTMNRNTASLSQNQYHLVPAPPSAYMNTPSFIDHNLGAGGPDSNHQPQPGSDFEMNIPGPPDPAPAPPPDRQPEITVKLSTSHVPLVYNHSDGAMNFEIWLESSTQPRFSFSTHIITLTCSNNIPRYEIQSFPELRQIYTSFCQKMPSTSPFTLEVSLRQQPPYQSRRGGIVSQYRGHP